MEAINREGNAGIKVLTTFEPRKRKPLPPPTVYPQWTKEEMEEWCRKQFNLD